MGFFAFSRSALILSSATALLAGCSESQIPIGGPGAMNARLGFPSTAIPVAGGYKVLYSFQGLPDGIAPSGLTVVDGEFYGTTTGGGSCYLVGCGTVFKITPSGSEEVIYEFKGGRDGDRPVGNLVDVNGTLYGVTYYGGHKTRGSSYGSGTVFKVSTAGKEQVIYRFKGGNDAVNPSAGLTMLNGVLYGTTDHGGGSYGGGTVYEVTLSGRERVLYRFKGGAKDGEGPEAPLLAFHRKLYGTTDYGGCNLCDGGRGTVFSVSTTGVEHMLYAFQGADNGGDGAIPEAGLIVIGNVLYGTTVSGGYDKTRECGRSSGHGLGGCGTVFSITSAGKEQILYRFKGKSDGDRPVDALVALNGKLYGTTSTGGGSKQFYGDGTVFQVTVSGKERVLHRFAGPPDGSLPLANLTNLNGNLYGTTISGGSGCSSFSPPGCGTVFELSP